MAERVDMEDVQLKFTEQGQGAFTIREGTDLVGEMVVHISGSTLTVYHTEVSQKAEGRGLARSLLAVMVNHARKNGLKIVPLCPFVHAQFKRHPEEFADVWKQDHQKEETHREQKRHGHH